MIRRTVELRTSPSEESVPVPLVNPVTRLTASTVPLYPGAYLIQVQLEGGEGRRMEDMGLFFYRQQAQSLGWIVWTFGVGRILQYDCH